QGGANLSGNIVVGGDAEIAFACSAGTYLLFNPDRRCDGAGGEPDINPSFTAFPSADLAINGTTTPPPVGDNKARSATASASYTSAWESIAAINDGLEPGSSNDTVNPRWGTWPETGQQWAELTWPGAQVLNRAQAYLFDDNGGVRLPGSWKLQYWTGSAYADVAATSGYPVAANAYNTVTFNAVSTTRLRVVMQASGTASVGLLEVRAY
ncbi:hypothetical protein CLV67_116235, partial [Actinoplanes italicus]